MKNQPGRNTKTDLPFREMPEFIRDVQTDSVLIYNDQIVVVSLNRLAGMKLRRAQPALRLNAFSILMVTQGRLRVTIDYRPQVVKKNMLYTLVENHIISDLSMSTDFRGIHIVVAHDFFREAIRAVPPPPPEVVNAGKTNPVIQLAEGEFKMLLADAKKLQQSMKRPPHLYQTQIIQNTLATLALEIWDFMARRGAAQNPAARKSAAAEISFRFYEVLFQHSAKEHEVSFYARHLHISPAYLSRVLKKTAGKTAIQIINSAVLVEAKILLRNPGLNIQQVSDQLNFSEQSAFSRFFKKHTGLAPAAYRKQFPLRGAPGTPG